MQGLFTPVWPCRAIAIMSGLLVPFAFAPFNLYFLAILSLSLLFYLWISAASNKEAFILGYLFGFALFGFGVNWLHISINLFGGVNFIGSLCFTYVLVAFIALYPAACAYLVFRFFKPYWFIATPSLWVITEWCRGWVLSGFPWLNIGTSQTDSILANFAPLTGDYGLTFICCLLASAVVLLLKGTIKQRCISGSIIALIVITAILLSGINWTRNTGKTLTVALIQGAIPQEYKWLPELRPRTYEIYSRLSAPYWSSDLIIWPETAIPSLYHQSDDFIKPIQRQQEQGNALFMSGIAYKEQGKYFNSVLLIDDEHKFYNKHHLVPFGEYLPLKNTLEPFLNFLKIPMSDFSPGDPEQKLLYTDKGILGISICYEAAYTTEIRPSLPEAEILINVSNDAWFGDSLAPHQHLQIARMRALESGRYLLRSTNTGISAVIDEKGKIIDRSPLFEPYALYANVKLLQGATPFTRYGNLPIIGLCGLILTLLYLFAKKEKINE